MRYDSAIKSQMKDKVTTLPGRNSHRQGTVNTTLHWIDDEIGLSYRGATLDQKLSLDTVVTLEPVIDSYVNNEGDKVIDAPNSYIQMTIANLSYFNMRNLYLVLRDYFEENGEDAKTGDFEPMSEEEGETFGAAHDQ